MTKFLDINGAAYLVNKIKAWVESRISTLELDGVKGDKGDDGTDATITGASATSIASTEAPIVTLGGTPSARTFSFGIPAGVKGDKGDDGEDGTDGNDGEAGTPATITGATANPLASDAVPTVELGGTPSARTFAFGIPAGAKGDKGDAGDDGTNGADGNDGAAATVVEVPAISWPPVDAPGVLYVKVD